MYAFVKAKDLYFFVPQNRLSLLANPKHSGKSEVNYLRFLQYGAFIIAVILKITGSSKELGG